MDRLIYLFLYNFDIIFTVMQVKKTILVALICTFVDQFVKYLVVTKLEVLQTVSVIKGFFSITYLENTGAAFSLMVAKPILIIISIITLFLIYKYLLRDKNTSNSQSIIYGLLIGGIIGNLIDRIFLGHVIDYLDFTIFNYNFPVFNIADALIVISIILIIITYKGDKNEV